MWLFFPLLILVIYDRFGVARCTGEQYKNDFHSHFEHFSNIVHSTGVWVSDHVMHGSFLLDISSGKGYQPVHYLYYYFLRAILFSSYLFHFM